MRVPRPLPACSILRAQIVGSLEHRHAECDPGTEHSSSRFRDSPFYPLTLLPLPVPGLLMLLWPMEGRPSLGLGLLCRGLDLHFQATSQRQHLFLKFAFALWKPNVPLHSQQQSSTITTEKVISAPILGLILCYPDVTSN